jgi:beta-phosphoglucomutase
MKNYGFIFDMDGVIVDSNPYHKIALKQFCKKYGYDLSDDDLLAKIYGRTNKEWITNVFGILSPELLNEYAEEKEALYRQLHANDIVPLPGLRRFLIHLNQMGFPKAIGTSAPISNVDFILGKTGLAEFFPIILKDTDISHSKPHPEIYLKAAARLGLPPALCIVLEDSLSGIAAGQGAGAHVIGVATTHTPAELAHTDLVIVDFEGIDPQELVEKIWGTDLE